MGWNGITATRVQLYLAAAETGLAAAQFNLGVLTAKGLGIDADAEQAKNWFRKAAAQGHEPAQSNLEQLEAKTEGTDATNS